MKVAALVLYAIAFILEMSGAIGVIQDVRRSIANMRTFSADWEQAKATGWPEPAQEALAKHDLAQNEISDCRRWTAVGLLLGGLVVGLAGNVCSVLG
jgi:hypothetical protein